MKQALREYRCARVKCHPKAEKMTIDEVIQLLCASQQKSLTKLQEFVIRSAWEGKTYTSMATEAHYGSERIRKVASQLWSRVSELFGEPITKANFRPTLETRRLTKAQQQLIEEFHRRQTRATSLEYPSGPLSLNSRIYIPRPPIEELACAEIAEPGSVIRIKAPRKMGKSSLMLRILAHATGLGYHTVSVDFQQADKAVFASLEKFLRWLCVNVTRELQLEPRLDDYWDEDIGSKVSCTIYFQGYLLGQLSSPLVLALNEVNRVFEYPEIAQDFLPLLRFWYEKAKREEIWQKLRLVVAYSTEAYVPLNLSQSPFNVGLPLELPPFKQEQVQELARRYGLNWTDGAGKRYAASLQEMVGGHPYLVQLALYHLVNPPGVRGGENSANPAVGRGGENPPNPPGVRGGEKSANPGLGRGLEQLLQRAATASGIYKDHLRQLHAALLADAQLAAAFQQVIAAQESVKLPPILAYKLESMGLINLDGDRVCVSCQLYRLYFQGHLLELENSSDVRIKQLETENQELLRLSNLDEITGLANRRYFTQYLERMWQQLAGEKAPLSLILCDIDFFKIYNDAYGHLAGDLCLQQVASAISKCVKRPSDLAARFGGDEFAAILPHTDATEAVSLAEEIKNQVKALAIAHDEYRIGGCSLIVTVSVGVASTIPNSEYDPATIVHAADHALFDSKKQGRDRVTLSPTINFRLAAS